MRRKRKVSHLWEKILNFSLDSITLKSRTNKRMALFASTKCWLCEIKGIEFVLFATSF